MSISSQQFLQAARGEKADLEKAAAELDRLAGEHQQRRAAVEAERAQAMAELTQALLPELTRPALERAAQLAACPALVQDDPLAAMERERAALEQRRAAIEADVRFVDRELLRAPRTGTLTRHIAELEEFRAPLQQVVDTAAHPRLEHLLENGYGTDAYKVGWWRLSYYSDWKAGDEIAERFPGKTFGDVRAELLEARGSLAAFDQQLGDLRREVAAGEALEAEHGQAVAALASLPERTLAGARARLGQHLAGLEVADLGERLPEGSDLAVLWKRVSGLRAKLAYLDQIVDEQLVKPRGELRQQITKVTQEIAKWSRPKLAYAQYPADQYQRRFVDRRGRAWRYVDRYNRTYDTVYTFNRYDRGSLLEDFLWWDLMTGGRIDGGFIPGVSDWRASHPGYVYTPDPWRHHDDDAAAAAAQAAIGGGAELHHDAS
jgi:hypothetical protein